MDTMSAMTDTILNVEHLSMKFGGLVAIGDLSFQAKRGDITALIGPNGAGKTTVFDMVSGFLRPDRGAVWFAGHDVSTSGPDVRGRLGLGHREVDGHHEGR